MFHAIMQKKITFKSNPPLEPEFVVDYTTNAEGSPVNKFVLTDRSNKGHLQGAVYDPSVMSLRARLHRGVDLQKVGYDVTDNDLNRLYASAKRMSTELSSRAASRKQSVSSVVQTDSNPV